jgi:hypothetical protein
LSQHADRYQQVVARMAESSLKIKALTATAAGVLVPVAVERGRAGLLLVGVVLVVGLALLDAYYLSLERGVRSEADTLVHRLSVGEADWRDLFFISLPPSPTSPRELAKSLVSPATLLFYLLIAALLAVGCALS